jgi:hypothetical protein
MKIKLSAAKEVEWLQYLAKIKKLPNGSMVDGFPYLSVEFKGEE